MCRDVKFIYTNRDKFQWSEKKAISHFEIASSSGPFFLVPPAIGSRLKCPFDASKTQNWPSLMLPTKISCQAFFTLFKDYELFESHDHARDLSGWPARTHDRFYSWLGVWVNLGQTLQFLTIMKSRSVLLDNFCCKNVANSYELINNSKSVNSTKFFISLAQNLALQLPKITDCSKNQIKTFFSKLVTSFFSFIWKHMMHETLSTKGATFSSPYWPSRSIGDIISEPSHGRSEIGATIVTFWPAGA